MKSINVTGIRINLLSLIKLSTATGVAVGWVLGIVSLVASLLGGNTAANIFGLVQFHGVAAGLVNIVWVPVLLSIILGLLSIAAYWPFIWVSRAIGGCQLELQTEESNKAGRSRDPRSEELLVG